MRKFAVWAATMLFSISTTSIPAAFSTRLKRYEGFPQTRTFIAAGRRP